MTKTMLTVGFLGAALLLSAPAQAFTVTSNALGNGDAHANLNDPDDALDNAASGNSGGGASGLSFHFSGDSSGGSSYGNRNDFADHDASENPMSGGGHFSNAPFMPFMGR